MKNRIAVYLLIAMLCIACGKTPADQGASRVVHLFANAGENALLAVLMDPRSAEYIACDRDVGASYEVHPGGDPILLVSLANKVEIAVHALAYDENTGEFAITDTPCAFSGKLDEPIRLIAFLSEGIPSLKLVVSVLGMWAEWMITYDGRGTEGVRFLIGAPGSGTALLAEGERQARHIIENICKETRAAIAVGTVMENGGYLIKIDGADCYALHAVSKVGGVVMAVYAVDVACERVYRSYTFPEYAWEKIE